MTHLPSRSLTLSLSLSLSLSRLSTGSAPRRTRASSVCPQTWWTWATPRRPRRWPATWTTARGSTTTPSTPTTSRCSRPRRPTTCRARWDPAVPHSWSLALNTSLSCDQLTWFMCLSDFVAQICFNPFWICADSVFRLCESGHLKLDGDRLNNSTIIQYYYRIRVTQYRNTV